MTTPEPDPMTEAMQRRGLLGVVLLVVPILSIVLVGGAFLGLAVLGWQGRAVPGDRVRIVFDGCPDAQDAVATRVAFMGLLDPVFTETGDRFSLEVTLPPDPETAERVPQTLATVGALEVRPLEGGDAVITTADIAEATVELPFLAAPHAVLVLRPDAGVALRTHMESHPTDGVAVLVDGEEVYRRKNSPSVGGGRLAVDRPGASDLEQMQFAAELAAVLQAAPLPCAPTVSEVSAVDPR